MWIVEIGNPRTGERASAMAAEVDDAWEVLLRHPTMWNTIDRIMMGDCFDHAADSLADFPVSSITVEMVWGGPWVRVYHPAVSEDQP